MLFAVVITCALFPCDAAQNNNATTTADSIRSAALTVLQYRCNTCHTRQNPGKVFTPGNIDAFAAKIYQQVFVKRRMPRGKAKLSSGEQTTLLQWLKTQTVL